MSRRALKLVLPCLIVFLSWTYYLFYFDYGLTMNDEGLLVENAARVLNGQLPQRDFYGYPPLRYFYIAGWFAAAGETWQAERIAFAFVRTLTPLFLFLAARRFLSVRLALLPTVMVALVPGPWEKTIDTFLPIFSLWLVLMYLERGTRRRAGVMGVGAGLAFFVRQDLGLGILGAELAVLLLFGDGRLITREKGLHWDRARPGTLAVYGAGVVAGLAPVLVGYALVGALPALYAGLWTAVSVEQAFGLRLLGLVGKFDPRHPRALVEGILLVLSFLALAWFPFAAWLKWRATGTLAPKEVAAWLMGCIAYPLTFLVAGYTRMVQTAPIGYVLGTLEARWLVEGVRGRGERLGRVVTIGCLMIPLAFLVYGLTDNDMFVGSAAIRLNRDAPLNAATARLYENEGNVGALDAVIDHVLAKTGADDAIFASFDHGFYFLTGRRNPTGIYFLPAHLDTDPALRAQFLDDLERDPPKVLISRVSDLDSAAIYTPWWKDYIAREFAPAFRNEQYVVYDRKMKP